MPIEKNLSCSFFPDLVSMYLCIRLQGTLTHAQMGDGLQLFVGGCLMNGSGESEREEKDVPKVRARNSQE